MHAQIHHARKCNLSSPIYTHCPAWVHMQASMVAQVQCVDIKGESERVNFHDGYCEIDTHRKYSHSEMVAKFLGTYKDIN